MADTKLSAIAAAGTIGGTDTVIGVQSGPTDVQYTITNLATFFWASPTLVTPTIGVATATTVNKVTITAPAASATLTIANGKTLTASNTITFTATDGSTLAIGAGGTLGTAAYATLGTSGTTVPLLDGTNTWSATQTFASVVLGASNTLSWTGRSIITSPAAGSTQLGDVDNAAGASVVAQILRGQSVAAGGTNNQTAKNMTVVGSLSTGTGTNGDIIFQTGITGSSGSTQNTATTALTIKGETQRANFAGIVQVNGGSQVIIGAASQALNGSAASTLFAVGAGSTPAIAVVNTGAQSSTAAGGGILRLAHNNNVAMASGNRLATILLSGASDASNTLALGATIIAYATETFSGSARGTDFVVETAQKTTTTLTERIRLTSLGSAVLGSAAIATNATDGFIYIPSCAGTPTGVPTTFTGRSALVYDSTNKQFWIYDGAWLQPKTPAGAALVTWQ